MSTDERLAAVLLLHGPIPDYNGEIDQCECVAWHGPETWFTHDKRHPESRYVAASLMCLRLRAALATEETP